MADVNFVSLREWMDDHSPPSWTQSTIDFNFFDFDPEFPPSDVDLRRPQITGGEEEEGVTDIETELEDHFFSRRQSSVVFNDDDVAVSEIAYNDRENQINFVMDLVRDRVEMADVDYMDSTGLRDSGFGLVDRRNSDGLNLELGLGLDYGSRVEIDDEDDFFLEGRRFSADASTVGSHFRVSEFSRDSAEEVDEYHLGLGVPLRWDAIRLDDHSLAIVDDLEWEEVDARFDESERLSPLLIEQDITYGGGGGGSVSVSVSGLDEEELVALEAETLQWEILLNTNSLDHNAENDEPYMGENDYIRPWEYDMMFGQLGETETGAVSTGSRPPAAKSSVENLPTVVTTHEDLTNNDATCAICKDDIGVGEEAKKLPCSHRYHGDCIVPWLAIRNTCPVCRHELPTDNFEYERRRARMTVIGLLR